VYGRSGVGEGRQQCQLRRVTCLIDLNFARETSCIACMSVQTEFLAYFCSGPKMIVLRDSHVVGIGTQSRPRC
jgi:hypothetical protein